MGSPGNGDHDEEKKEAPRQTRIPVLGAPAGAAARNFRAGADFHSPLGAILEQLRTQHKAAATRIFYAAVPRLQPSF